MSKVFKMDKATREVALKNVAEKVAAVTGWPIKESDRKENYFFMDPVLTMAAYNEGVRFCVQSAAKTINVCLEIYSRKEGEAKVQAFAVAMAAKFAGTLVAGVPIEWAVIYKGGLLRVAVPANKTADEIASVMAEFRTLVMPDYITFMEGVSPVEAKPAKVKKVKEVAPVAPVAAPAVDEVPVVEAPAEVPPGEVIEEEPDLA